MNLPSTYAVASLTKSLGSLRHLRKVKLFIQPRAITVVAYYKDTATGETHSYRGRAYIFTYTTWKGTSVALAHTSHLPPPDQTDADQDQGQEEIDLEPAPIMPGFGFRTV